MAMDQKKSGAPKMDQPIILTQEPDFGVPFIPSTFQPSPCLDNLNASKEQLQELQHATCNCLRSCK